MPKLSREDVKRLIADPSGDNRAETADKIAKDFGAGVLSESERKLAEDILRLMVRDAEMRVRLALSKNLKESPLVPHDVAKTLAQDVAEVSIPILRFSEVLTDEDLCEIVRSQGDATAKHVAIAEREHISEGLADVLVDTHNEDVVASLVANEGAEISERSFHKVIDEFGHNERIQKPMVGRRKLPLTIAERMVTLVSETLRQELVSRRHIPEGVVRAVMAQSQESATIGLIGPDTEDRDVELLVDHLFGNNRLTPGLVLRALCMGDIAFFEAALARRAGVSLVNARTLVHDAGPYGLEAIYNKAAMPGQFLPGVAAALSVSRETYLDGGERDRERYSRRMIERILTQYGDLGVEFDRDDVDYLVGRMLQLPGDSIAESADDSA